MQTQQTGLTPEQHEIRRTGIGASEAAVILGRSKYAAPIDVYRRKVYGQREPETVPMKRGRLLESAVLNWYAEDMDSELQRQPELGTQRSSEFPHLLATPDAYNLSLSRAVDAKALRRERITEFGREGSDEVADDFLIQLQVQMGVFKVNAADLPVLFGGDELRIFHVKFSRSLYEKVGDLVERFWRDHVETKTPPTADSSASYSEWLSQQFSTRKTKTVREATLEERSVLHELRVDSDALERIKARVELNRNKLRAAIGEDYGITAPEIGKALWTGGELTKRTDWKAVGMAAIARLMLRGDEVEATKIVGENTVENPSARALRLTWIGEE